MNASDDVFVQLLRPLLGDIHAQRLLERVAVLPDIAGHSGKDVSRAAIAQALCLLLFDDLLQRVPLAQAYVEESFRAGRSIRFDHGALRTVKWKECGALPSGEAAITRILLPLGYKMADEYPLPKLGMTGRAYCHLDHPYDIAQFFVSELHPERFSAPFQNAVSRVLGTSHDPLPAWAVARLQELAERRTLPLTAAAQLLPELKACFDRQHEPARLDDYECLLKESTEMAWISTEGQAYNHATDRVTDVTTLASEQKAGGRPMKEVIEVSENGRVIQTAYKACQVERLFVGKDGRFVTKQVPGSFFEFITRHSMIDPVSGKEVIDLSFDSSNATGIFAMTATK